jgi:hypothetical protein
LLLVLLLEAAHLLPLLCLLLLTCLSMLLSCIPAVLPQQMIYPCQNLGRLSPFPILTLSELLLEGSGIPHCQLLDLPLYWLQGHLPQSFSACWSLWV